MRLPVNVDKDCAPPCRSWLADRTRWACRSPSPSAGPWPRIARCASHTTNPSTPPQTIPSAMATSQCRRKAWRYVMTPAVPAGSPGVAGPLAQPRLPAERPRRRQSGHGRDQGSIVAQWIGFVRRHEAHSSQLNLGRNRDAREKNVHGKEKSTRSRRARATLMADAGRPSSLPRRLFVEDHGCLRGSLQENRRTSTTSRPTTTAWPGPP